MKYKYNNQIYSTALRKDEGDKDIYDLLYDLENRGEIETHRINVYNTKGYDNYYRDDEVDAFLDDLVEDEIIEEVNEKNKWSYDK